MKTYFGMVISNISKKNIISFMTSITNKINHFYQKRINWYFIMLIADHI